MIDMSPTPTPALPEQPSPPFELRHASTACPFVVFVPERRLLAIDGTGTREAADFALASEVLRTVAAIVPLPLPSASGQGAQARRTMQALTRQRSRRPQASFSPERAYIHAPGSPATNEIT